MSKRMKISKIAAALIVTTMGALAVDGPNDLGYPYNDGKGPFLFNRSKVVTPFGENLAQGSVKISSRDVLWGATKFAFKNSRFIWTNLPLGAKLGVWGVMGGFVCGFGVGTVFGEFMSPFHWIGRKK